MTILSVLIIIAGIVMLILSIMFQTGTDNIMDADLGEMTSDIEQFKNAMFATLLVFSLVAIGTGIGGALCGCAPCRKASCCWAVVYAIPLGLTWLVYLIVGIVITGVSTQGVDTIQRFCDAEDLKRDEVK